MEKNDARKLSTDDQQEIRYQVIHLKTLGHRRAAISATTGIHPSTVSAWWRLYKDGGQKALKIKKRGRPIGACRILTEDQEKELQKIIYEKFPDQMKLPFTLWTRIAVQQLIMQLWSIKIPIRTLGEYLKRWGFTTQRPLRKAYRQDPQALKIWLETEYPDIAERAQKENAEIHWGDEAGLSNDSEYGRNYEYSGETSDIRIHPRGKRVNLISTVTNQGKIRFMVYGSRMNSQTLIKFMGRLTKKSERKLFLILDNLKAHRTHLIKEWIKKHENQIEVFYIPAYSPELKPDKYLSCELKVDVTMEFRL